MDKNEESQTPAGIWKITDTDWQPAVHANRISEIVMVPDELHYHLAWHKKKPEVAESMPWKTDMQVQVGDIVWHDYMDSLNCPIIIVRDEPDEQYKLLNYYDLYVAKRSTSLSASPDNDLLYMNGVHLMVKNRTVFEIIPLNGYVLCEEVMEEKQGDLDVLDQHVNKKLGKVAFIGQKNYEYRWEQIKKPPKGRDLDGEDILEVGDVIVKKRPDIHIMLEAPEHAKFNGSKMYFVTQRRNIYGKKI